MLPQSCLYLCLFATIISWLLFPYYGLYKTWRGIPLLKEIRLFIYASTSLFLFMTAALYMLKRGEMFARTWFLCWFFLTLIIGCAARISLRLILRRLRSQGFNRKKIVMVGNPGAVTHAVENIRKASWTGLFMLGYFTDESEANGENASEISLLGRTEDLCSYVKNNCVDQVWIVLSLSESYKIRSIVDALRHETVDIRFVPDVFAVDLLNYSVSEIAGLPVVDLSVAPLSLDCRVMKEIEDKVMAGLILLLIWPLMLVIAACIKFSSRGPVFYRQKRVSVNGKTFLMLKFRTMPEDAEERSGPVWAGPADTRATGLGHFLRRTSLDELPQFINVLKGDMSIVGPRPERPFFVETFKDQIPGYMKKHMVKAGITGWAQVNGWRGDTSLEKRIEHDLYYISNWSLLFDLKIILMTFYKGFFSENAY